MFEKTVVGGTFDGLHKGHEKLLSTAMDVSGRLTVGLTSDEFANRFRTKLVKSFDDRKRILEDFLETLNGSYEIVEINDSYGFATIKEDVEAIVVSEETLLRAEEINQIRFKKKLPKLTVIVVPLVLDETGRPLSNSD